MNTKLTLKLNQDVILAAKKYAKENGQSLSKLVEQLLSTLTEFPQKPSIKQKKATPIVDSLSGIVKADSINKEELYSDYLINKYL